MTDLPSSLDSYRLKKILAYVAIIAGGVLAFGLLAPVVLPLAFAASALAIVIGCPVWVFLDARKIGLKRAIFWALLALFAPVVGTVIYLISRPEEPLVSTCPGCGETLLASYALCPQCGQDLPAPHRFCHACNHELEQAWKFCPYCRVDLAQKPSSGLCPRCSLKVETSWRFCPMCEAPLTTQEAASPSGGLS